MKEASSGKTTNLFQLVFVQVRPPPDSRVDDVRKALPAGDLESMLSNLFLPHKLECLSISNCLHPGGFIIKLFTVIIDFVM
jgi:hypothetical protein